jgi:hypothetical protein
MVVEILRETFPFNGNRLSPDPFAETISDSLGYSGDDKT